MAHTLYPNKVLEVKVADFMNTKLGVSPFFTSDTSLAQSAGMTKTINVYTADGAVRDVAQGEGNIVGDDVNVSFTPVEYTVKYVQGRMVYFDEEVLKDPMVVTVGLDKMSANMVNDLTTKFYAELAKATNGVNYLATGLAYEAIVDATTTFGESEEGLFLLINPAQKGQLRKALKDSLQYVEGIVRTGYIGSVNNIPIYISNQVPANIAYIATKEAVTVFTKKEVETEQERDANLRKNSIFNRRCNVVALTDATKVVKLFAPDAIATIKAISVKKDAALPTTITVNLSDGSTVDYPAEYAGTYSTAEVGLISNTKIKIGTTEYAIAITVVAAE